MMGDSQRKRSGRWEVIEFQELVFCYLIHFNIQLGKVAEIVKGKPVVLMPINVLEVNLDGEFACNHPDGVDKISMCNGPACTVLQYVW
jgi:hypothetical protein